MEASESWTTPHGNALGLFPEFNPVYTVFRKAYFDMGYVFTTSGMDKEIGYKWAAMAMVFPQLRSFLINYVPREKTPNAYDCDMPNTQRWYTTKQLTDKILEIHYAELNKIIREDRKRLEEERMSKRMPFSRRWMGNIPWEVADTRIPFPNMIREWIGDSYPGDSALASGMALMASMHLRKPNFETLDVFPWWESRENINAYTNGSK